MSIDYIILCMYLTLTLLLHEFLSTSDIPLDCEEISLEEAIKMVDGDRRPRRHNHHQQSSKDDDTSCCSSEISSSFDSTTTTTTKKSL